MKNLGNNEKPWFYLWKHRNGARPHVTASRHGVTASYGRFGCLGQGSKPWKDLISMPSLWNCLHPNQDQDMFGCLGVGSKPWGDFISMALLWYRFRPNEDLYIFWCPVWFPNHWKILSIWLHFGTVFIKIYIVFFVFWCGLQSMCFHIGFNGKHVFS